MKIAAVIAEYNPFHNGHKYHIEKTRQITGADVIVVIMSANFVQRSEPALFSKEVRTKMALSCGADIVLELPSRNVLQTAEKYAESAVTIANAIHADFLSFGSECGNIDALTKIAKYTVSDEFNVEIKSKLQSGISFSAARQAVLDEYDLKISEIGKMPNNILGIEYIKAIEKLNSSIKPVTVQRIGAGHDSVDENMFSSASLIRSKINNGEDVSEYVPREVFEIIKEENTFNYEMFDRTVLSSLVLSDLEKLSSIRDVSEGLEYRIVDNLKNSASVGELIDNIKTKRYTHSRLRRIVLSNYLGLTGIEMPQYVRLLGLKKDVSLYWKEIKSSSSLPVIEKAANNDSKLLMENIRIDEVWNCFTDKVNKYGSEYTHFPIIC